MPQKARPFMDRYNISMGNIYKRGFKGLPRDSTEDIYQEIDEETPSDLDYIQSINAENSLESNLYICKVTALKNPQSPTEHFVRYRYKILTSSGVCTYLRVKLVSGYSPGVTQGRLVQEWFHRIDVNQNLDEWIEATQSFTPIPNMRYDDLYLFFQADYFPSLEQCEVSCQVACLGGCQFACQSSCLNIGCQSFCEALCAYGCTVICQRPCELNCETPCQNTCEKGCEGGCVSYCMTWCMGGCMAETCQTANQVCDCQVTCTANCQAVCQPLCAATCQNTCQRDCQSSCQQWSCQPGCVGMCTLGCQWGCEARCQLFCETQSPQIF